MAAQHRMSARPGLPAQGSRGSSQGLGVAGACWSSVAWSSAAAGADKSAAAAVGSSVTALRYTWAAVITNASRGGGHGEHVPGTGDGAPDGGRRGGVHGCLDEAQRSVRSNGFELDGVRRDWSYLPA